MQDACADVRYDLEGEVKVKWNREVSIAIEVQWLLINEQQTDKQIKPT
jgi:hypothetical protein